MSLDDPTMSIICCNVLFIAGLVVFAAVFENTNAPTAAPIATITSNMNEYMNHRLCLFSQWTYSRKELRESSWEERWACDDLPSFRPSLYQMNYIEVVGSLRALISPKAQHAGTRHPLMATP